MNYDDEQKNANAQRDSILEVALMMARAEYPNSSPTAQRAYAEVLLRRAAAEAGRRKA